MSAIALIDTVDRQVFTDDKTHNDGVLRSVSRAVQPLTLFTELADEDTKNESWNETL